jgi:hypothetical protein
MGMEFLICALFNACNQSQSQNTLFSLGVVTYSYERQDIIQFALKRHRGGKTAVEKKSQIPSSPPFTFTLEKCSRHVNLIRYTINYTTLLLLLMKIIIRTFLHYNQADSIPHFASYQVALTKKGVQVKLSKACPPFTWL